MAEGRERDDDLDLTPVLRTNNPSLLMAFQAALNGAEIPHFVRGAEAASLMPVNAVVVVPREHAEAAQELLREAEADHIQADAPDGSPEDAGD